MKNLLISSSFFLLVACATMPDAIAPPPEQIIELDPTTLQLCDPLIQIKEPITFENVLQVTIENINIYAKCADKQKTSVKLLKQISNVKE